MSIMPQSVSQPASNQPAYARPQLAVLLGRLAEQPRFIQILAGPRQVGKTTLIQQAASHLGDRLLYAAADLPSAPTPEWIQQQWMRVTLAAQAEAAQPKNKRAAASSRPWVLVLDEVQKIPRWSETIKALWDRRPKNIHLVLLGSSEFLVQQGLTESLAGRFERIRVPHWSYSEMRDAFGWTVDQFIQFGGYPGPAPLIQWPERWRGYLQDAIIEPIVTRDVMSLARIDKPILLRRLMELGCIYSGQMVSYQKLQGQLQDAGNTTTLAHYLQLLTSAWMLTGLPKFAGDQARQRASSPKLQVYNTALQSSQGPAFRSPAFQRHDPEQWGRLVESAVGAHLLNSLPADARLYYWRDRNMEVDFVVQTPQQLLAIEVKSGARLRNPNGLSAFCKAYPQATPVVVGTGGVPLNEFLAFTQLF